MFIYSHKLCERLHLLNAWFPQVAAFVNSPQYHISASPLTQARLAASLTGNMTLNHFE
jgi:hypothetical protein